MKIEFVEVSGFRGFKDRTRFELPAGFAILTGHNGAGKSTVLDAIDFALTGSINKYPVRTARGGGLDDHIWWVGSGQAKEHMVSVGFIKDDGGRFTITRTRRGLVDQGPEGVYLLCGGDSAKVSAETLMKTTLIRETKVDCSAKCRSVGASSLRGRPRSYRRACWARLFGADARDSRCRHQGAR